MGNVLPKTTPEGEPLFSAYLHNRANARGVPLAGTFELTGRCNFSCKMCYVHELSCQPHQELSAEEWIGIGESARDAGMLFLLLTGGEPLLRKDFKEIYLELRKMGFMISVNTNASLISGEALELFRQYPPVRLNVSLYGGSNETYKNLCGAPAFDMVLTNLRALKAAGLAVKINCSVTPYNGGDIEKIYAIAQELECPVQATSYMYPPVRVNGCQYGQAPARFSPLEAAEHQLRCREQYLTPQQLAASAYALPETEAECAGEQGEPMRCRAGRTALWITWDGRMQSCGTFPNGGYSLREMSFDQAWTRVREETMEIHMPSACTNCELKKQCIACAAACAAETGSTTGKPEYICQMMRHLNRLTREKYGEVIE